MMVYGFKALVTDFLMTHPGHHINPRRVNGSGVETLFGQLKHTTSGNLTASNYETAKAAMLAKRMVQGRKANDDYRNTPLCIRQSELRRKKWYINNQTSDCLLTANVFNVSLSPTLASTAFFCLMQSYYARTHWP